MFKKIGLIVLFLCSIHSAAQAYVIDGFVNDWGIDLANPASLNKNYLDTHTPTGATVNFATEDNTDVFNGLVVVGPGRSVGNIYDAEAMYFDNDQTNAFLAVVTGVSPTEGVYPAGDIFIDTGKYQNPLSPFYDIKKYQYAINIANGKLYEVTSWQDVAFFHDADPWRMGTGNYIMDVPFVYSGAQNSHYVLESQFSLSALNLKDGDIAYLQWTMKCGNDDLKVNGSVNVVPEPASIALLSSGLLMGINRFRLRKKV